MCVGRRQKYNGTRRNGKPEMPLTISDKMLQDAGMTAKDARIEVGCRLYAADKLTLRGGRSTPTRAKSRQYDAMSRCSKTKLL